MRSRSGLSKSYLHSAVFAKAGFASCLPDAWSHAFVQASAASSSSNTRRPCCSYFIEAPVPGTSFSVQAMSFLQFSLLALAQPTAVKSSAD